MVFSSYTFLFLFLPAVCIVYFLLPSLKGKNVCLLISSLFFYGWNSPEFLPVLLASIILNYLTGMGIHCACRKKKAVLVTGVLLNIALLGYFKYANFTVQNLSRLFPEIGVDWMQVILPLGISFFTFQGMSYIIDVYRNDGRVLKNPLDVGLYIALFPQLVAGPIVRFKSIAAELHSRSITIDNIGFGFRRFVYGLSKKLIFANTFGMIADTVFNDPSVWNMGNTWIGILAYTFQIYYDFSGYSDMAIGLGSIFGFHFGENFMYPYASGSITEFWRRWHISLSSWFRDYVYIPLGGSRTTKVKHIRNILVVWALTGLWHGADWTFVCWGIYYGLLLLLEKFVLGKKLGSIPLIIRWAFTFLLVMIGWVLFRADTLGLASDYLRAMFSFDFTYAAKISFLRDSVNYAVFWILGIVCAFPLMPAITKKLDRLGLRDKTGYLLIKNVFVAVLFLTSILFLLSGSYNAFIYFQF